MRNKGLAKHYYAMMIPGFVWLVLFSIVPMGGILMAFQDYNPGSGLFGSPWVGLAHFEYLFQLSDAFEIFRNTIVIAVLKILGNLFFPLVFALLLNELRIKVRKKGIQTISYLPHFLSWVILGGIMFDMFSLSGPVNQLIAAAGGKPIAFFAKPEIFTWLVVFSDVWKEFGYNAIFYLAALTAISESLYESASIDGATRWQQLWTITIPGIQTTVILLAALSLGNVLNAGFDQIFNLYNPVVYSTGDIIDTWVYRAGLIDLQYSLATAAGLLKSVVGFFLIILSYFLADKYAHYRIF